MARYDNIDKIKDENITRIGTSYLPKVKEQNSDVLLIATEGDRCAHLAQEYYGDVNLWWYIARANGLKFMTLKAGTRLRIPATTQFALGR